MGTKRLSIVLAATCLLGATAIPEANARIHRNDCFARASVGARGRDMGVRNSTRLFNAVWNRLGRSCAQLERLAQIIADTPLAAPMTRGAFQACFYQGYVENLFDQLDLAYTRCGDRCFSSGAEIGKISAVGYCAVSAAVGGLDDPGFIEQPSLPFCGTNLVIGCKTEYVEQAVYEIQGCSMFTDGQFAQIFDNTVRQDCFVPSDVPIRDGYFGRAL